MGNFLQDLANDKIKRQRDLEDWKAKQIFSMQLKHAENRIKSSEPNVSQDRLMRQFDMEHKPDITSSIGGIPGVGEYEQRAAANMADATLQRGPMGSSTFRPNEVARQTNTFRSVPNRQVVMGTKGFEMQKPNVKDTIYDRIQKKKNAGYTLTNREKEFENNYLGIKDSVTTADQLDSNDRMKIRNLAEKMANPDGLQDTTEEDIQANIPKATKFLFPNIQIDESTADKANIHIPDKIIKGGKASDALNYLINTYGMTEEEARNWLKANW